LAASSSYEGARPFSLNVLRGEVDQFEQCHIIGERPFSLCNLTNLAMEPFRGVGGIDDLPDGFKSILSQIDNSKN